MKQKKLADAIIEASKSPIAKSAKELLLNAGYSDVAAMHQSSVMLNAPGVLEELNRRGFSVQAADNVVEHIMNKEEAQDKDRLKAADMMYERLGAKAPERSVHLNVNADSKDFEKYASIALEYDEKMKAKLLGEAE